MLEESKSLGCCHDVSIDIDGIEIKSQIFVIEHCNADLILGRPWERAVRIRYCTSTRMMDHIRRLLKVRMGAGLQNFVWYRGNMKEIMNMFDMQRKRVLDRIF